MKTIAILLAAGEGKRFGNDKVLLNLDGKTVLEHSLDVFSDTKLINQIVIAANTKNIEQIQGIAKKYKKVKNIITGGKTRFQSTIKGFKSIETEDNDLLIFHNAANPFVTKKEVETCIKEAKKNGAAGVAHKATSTVRFKGKVIPRNLVYLMETPQVLKSEIFEKGMKIAIKKKMDPTDDLLLAELCDVKPKIIIASSKNKKITTKSDLKTRYRTGIGDDSHKFSDSGTCILGGMKFKGIPKLEANSDGDAAMHALTNAILSSMGEGSLSRFSDKMCKTVSTDSKKYLKVALDKLKKVNGEIENVSLSFECLRPKLEKVFPKMKQVLSKILNIKADKIGLTATTGEGLTSFGKGEGVRVSASVLIKLKG